MTGSQTRTSSTPRRPHPFPRVRPVAALAVRLVLEPTDLDVGWADVYRWNLADKFMDITGLAPGIYELEQIANPNGATSIVESSYTDYRASTIVCVTQTSATGVTTDLDAALWD